MTGRQLSSAPDFKGQVPMSQLSRGGSLSPYCLESSYPWMQETDGQLAPSGTSAKEDRGSRTSTDGAAQVSQRAVGEGTLGGRRKGWIRATRK